MWQGGLDRHEDRSDVDGENAVVFGHRELLYWALMRGARVVHQDLEATEAADGLRYRCAKRLGICTVGLDRQRLAAGTDDLLLKVVGCVRGRAIRERHGGAIGGE